MDSSPGRKPAASSYKKRANLVAGPDQWQDELLVSNCLSNRLLRVPRRRGVPFLKALLFIPHERITVHPNRFEP